MKRWAVSAVHTAAEASILVAELSAGGIASMADENDLTGRWSVVVEAQRASGGIVLSVHRISGRDGTFYEFRRLTSGLRWKSRDTALLDRERGTLMDDKGGKGSKDTSGPNLGTVLPIGKTDEGHMRCLVKRGDEVQPMTFVHAKEGQPMMTPEYAVVSDMPGTPFLSAEFHDNPVLPKVKVDASAADRDGPARVNSQAFRDGWDRIFGHKAVAGET